MPSAVMGGTSSIIHQFTVTLDNDQVLHLPTSPVDIVSAPGPNKRFVYSNGLVILDNRAGVYGNVASDQGNLSALIIKTAGFAILSSIGTWSWALGDGSDVVHVDLPPYVDLLSVITTAVEPQVATAWANTIDAWSDYQTGYLNSAMQLTCANGYNTPIGDLTGGHENNSLVVSGTYHILNTLTGTFE